jgi:hypothetical protein
MPNRNWEADFRKLLKRERKAQREKVVAFGRIHAENTKESWDEFEMACERHDKAAEALNLFMRQYTDFLETRRPTT